MRKRDVTFNKKQRQIEVLHSRKTQGNGMVVSYSVKRMGNRGITFNKNKPEIGITHSTKSRGNEMLH